MKNISTLKNGEDIVLYYEETEVNGEKYLITFRYSEDRRFISDDSILDLWKGSLENMTWVSPNMSQEFALEVYDRKGGYFNSIGPVIITETNSRVDEELLENLFKDIENLIEAQKSSSSYEKDFLKALDNNNFSNHFVGGGCSIKID